MMEHFFLTILIKTYDNLKNEIKFVMNWLKSNKLSLNDDKTEVMVFDNIQECDKIEVVLDDCSIIIEEEKVRSKKYLGLVLDHKLNFLEHIDFIKKKIAKRIGAMYKSKNLLPLKYRKMFANSLMLPYYDYLDIIWNKTYKTNLNELDILDYNKLENSMKVYKDMKWLPLHLHRQLHMSTNMFKIIRDKLVYITGGSRDGNMCNLYTNKSKTQTILLLRCKMLEHIIATAI